MPLLRFALVIVYLAAAALPCLPPAAPEAAPERMHAYTAGAVHAHGGTRAAAPASGLHGVALLPADSAPRLPRAVQAHAPASHLSHAPAQLHDPVPRLA